MPSRTQWSWTLRRSIRPGSRTSIVTIKTKMTTGTNHRVAGTNCSGIINGMAIATTSVRTTGSRGSPCGSSPAPLPEPAGVSGRRSMPAMLAYRQRARPLFGETVRILDAQGHYPSARIPSPLQAGPGWHGALLSGRRTEQ